MQMMKGLTKEVRPAGIVEHVPKNYAEKRQLIDYLLKQDDIKSGFSSNESIYNELQMSGKYPSILKGQSWNNQNPNCLRKHSKF